MADTIARVRVGALIVLVFQLLFVAVDFYSSPDVAIIMYRYRVLNAALAALLLGSTWHRNFVRFWRGATLSFCCEQVLVEAWACSVAQRVEPHYLVLLLFPLGSGALIPWGLTSQMLMNLVSLACFTGSSLRLPSNPETPFLWMGYMAALTIAHFSARLAERHSRVRGANLNALRESEEHLRLSEGHLRAIVETAPASVMVISTDGILQSINPTGLAMMEAEDAEQVVGRSVYSWVVPEYRDAVTAATESAIAGLRATAEFQGVSLKGTHRWLETHVVSFQSNQSRALLAVTLDITERKRAEEEAHLLQSVIKAVATAPDFPSALGIAISRVCEATGWVLGQAWVPSSDHSVLECSSIWFSDGSDTKLFRQASEQSRFASGIGLPGRVWTSGQPAWVPDVTLDFNFPRASSAEQAGFKAAMGIPVLTDSGAVVAVIEFYVREVRREDPRLMRLVSAVATQLGSLFQRKKAEAAQQGTELQVRAIIDNAFDAVIAMNAAGTVTAWNPRAAVMFGWSRQEALGRRLSDLIIPARYQQAHRKGLERYLATGDGPVLNKIIELSALHRDGHEFPVEMTVSAAGAGGALSFSAFVRDISDRKKAERELIRAREEALQASKTKSEFLSNMSHEIRTPMTAIIGVTELLAETPLNAEQRKYLGIASTNGSALLDLIDEILDLSRVENGQFKLETTRFNLTELLEKTTEAFVIRARDKGLSFSSNIAPALPTDLIGDPRRLRQVLANLIGNAIKFTKQGEVRLLVVSDRCAQGPGDLCFSVTDTGIGIAKEKQEAVFAAFTQADSSITREYGGTGLGLAISKRLVELMGGRIWVESELNVGSTFYFTVRLNVPGHCKAADFAHSQLSASTTATDAQKIRNVTVERNGMRRLRILIADDSEDNRLVLQAYLQNTPFQLEMAENGKQALGKFVASRYDLVLIDMQMPVLDGYSAVRAIRKWETENGRAPTPIVALSAYALKEEVARSLEAGCDRHITKPIKRDALLKAIGEVTSVRPDRVSPSPDQTSIEPEHVIAAPPTTGID